MIWRIASDARCFPAVLIVLSVAAAIRYAVEGGEWRRVVYWLAAAVLQAAVTF